jgi:lipopolysaccharide export system permease protein
MRLLDRYLLRELFVPFAYCLSGFFIFIIFSDLFVKLGEFQKNKMHGLDVLEYYLAFAPTFLVILLPVALLLALLFTLTNHARHHEITAIRSAGISLWRLCLPYLGVGFLASISLFALNEFWIPQSEERAEMIMTRRVSATRGIANKRKVRDLGVINSRENRVWKIGIYDTETTEMQRVQVTSTMNDATRLAVYGERAIRISGVWTFYDAAVYRVLLGTNALPQLLLRTNMLPKPEFTETPQQIKSEIKLSTASLKPVKTADVPLSELISYLRLHPHPRPKERFRLYTQLHGRLATPWTCLIVVLIAIPFGAASGRRNVFFGVAGSILICFSYFVLQTLALGLGSGGIIPPWVAGWLPNIVFGLTGIILTSRVR